MTLKDKAITEPFGNNDVYWSRDIAQEIDELKEIIKDMTFCQEHRCSLSICNGQKHNEYFKVVWADTLLGVIDSKFGDIR